MRSARAVIPEALRAAYWRVRQGGVLDLVPDEALPDRLFLVRRHYRATGRLRLFLRPRTFSEHVYRKMMWDRSPALQQSAEKVAARDYVAARIGAAYLIPAPFIGDRPEEIPFDRLPDQFVIKASHGSRFNIVVRDKAALDRDAVRRKLRGWLDTDFARIHREWCYRGVARRILVETLLQDNGALPSDHKIFVFGGRVRMIQLVSGREVDHRHTFFDERWRPLRVKLPHRDTLNPPPPPPDNLAELIRIAERLGAGFEFCRVDLYSVRGTIYFGEITHYPHSGKLRFDPPEFDAALGAVWRDGSAIPAAFYRA